MGSLSEQWGAAWNAPQADAPTPSGPQDGEYDVTVQRVVFSEVNTKGELCPPTFIFFLTNEFGETWKHYQTLKSQKAVWYLKGWMRRLGLAIPATPDGILGSLKALEGCVVHIQVTHHEWQGRQKHDIALQRIVSRPGAPIQAQAQNAPCAQTSAQCAAYPQAQPAQPWQPPQQAWQPPQQAWPSPQAQLDAAFPPTQPQPQPQPQAVQYAQAAPAPAQYQAQPAQMAQPQIVTQATQAAPQGEAMGGYVPYSDAIF